MCLTNGFACPLQSRDVHQQQGQTKMSKSKGVTEEREKRKQALKTWVSIYQNKTFGHHEPVLQCQFEGDHGSGKTDASLIIRYGGYVFGEPTTKLMPPGWPQTHPPRCRQQCKPKRKKEKLKKKKKKNFTRETTPPGET